MEVRQFNRQEDWDVKGDVLQGRCSRAGTRGQTVSAGSCLLPGEHRTHSRWFHLWWLGPEQATEMLAGYFLSLETL